MTRRRKRPSNQLKISIIDNSVINIHFHAVETPKKASNGSKASWSSQVLQGTLATVLGTLLAKWIEHSRMADLGCYVFAEIIK